MTIKAASPGHGHLLRRRIPLLLRRRRHAPPISSSSIFQKLSRTCCALFDNSEGSSDGEAIFAARYFHAFNYGVRKYRSELRVLQQPICGARPELYEVEDTVYKYNVRISSLGRRGQLLEARKLFDEMPQKDEITYGSMITMYLKHNDLYKAEELFYSMPQRNIVVDSAMVHAYAKVGRIEEARGIFDHMPERNVFTWTGLISGYFQNGRVGEACQLFQQMPEKNVVSWTTVVLGYARNGLIDDARTAFDQIPNKNVVAWTAMISAYIENYQVDEALQLFQQMPQRNLYSWNIMIQGCLLDKRVDDAIELFNSTPWKNAVTWTTMITGLARNGLTKLARKYFDQMPKKDIAAWNAMITAYAEEGQMVEANDIFKLMPKRNIVTYNAMIDGYTQNGPEDEAFGYLILMLRDSTSPNETTLTSILTSCRSIQELSQAHGLVIRLGFQRDTSLTNALVTMYSRTGDFSSAQFSFEDLEAKDTVSWTAMILTYCNHGYGNKALQVFARMLRSGSKPDEVTFVGVLSACSHAGLVDKGQKLFNSIRSYNLVPKAEHYSCLVDILGRAGLIDEAVRVVSQMPLEDRDGAVLGALLSACRLHGNVELANQIGRELIELEPDKSGAYVLLANSYARDGKWVEFALVRRKMKEREVKKVPGYSQIEVNGKNHMFFVGDKSHPNIKEIYTLLQKKLSPLMQKTGYIDINLMTLV